MKKIQNAVCYISIISLILSLFCVPVFADDDIRVQIDGQEDMISSYNDLKKNILGWWLYCSDVNDDISRKRAINMQFIEDGTVYIRSWHGDDEGTYTVEPPNKVTVSSHSYYNESVIYDEFEFNEGSLTLVSSEGKIKYIHTNKLMTADDIAHEFGTISQSYDNITNEVIQIQSYIDSGMYLEAMQLCNSTKFGRKISPEDEALLSKLHREAEAKYQNYLSDSQYANVQYDNVIDQLYQAMAYFNEGMYLEAIQVCEQTSAWYNLSPSDEARFNDLRDLSYMNYQKYLKEQNKWKNYRYDNWGICYTTRSTFRPYITDDDQIKVYENGFEKIEIASYKINKDINYDGSLITSIDEVLNDYKIVEQIATSNDRTGAYLEILSSNDTSVGNFQAKQFTCRAVYNMNRYGEDSISVMIRYTAFQYGNWIYVIEAMQPAYLWTDDFYEIMEKVRTSIYFA